MLTKPTKLLSHPLLCATMISSALLGCDSASEPEPVQLRFAATVDGKQVGCSDDLAGFGSTGANRIGINDLRFYISNVIFKDGNGNPVAATLDENEFQYASPQGAVALIDLTGNTEGTCDATAIASSEGTARTNTAITGTTLVEDVVSISFDVGVPQPLMKNIIATNTPEGAPSPLNEMYWNWNSGYRHFVFNFGVRDSAGASGAGFLHVGSRDCAPAGAGSKGLEDRDACTFINTPSVSLPSFDLRTDTIALDLRAVMRGLDLLVPIYDPVTREVIGQGPGVSCHSSPMQPDCQFVFSAFGLDLLTGKADPAAVQTFMRMQ